MKKSKSVPVVLVASVAAIALAGCGRNAQQVRRCVDNLGNILPDSQCYSPTRSSAGFYPHWVYGGTTSGRRVSGYSNVPSSSADVVDSKGSVVRRGFGSSGSGSSSSSRSSFGS